MLMLDGSNAKLYMHFNKELPSAQGMDIWQNYAYILFDTGCCGVYNLNSKDPQPIAFFRLGSYNEGIPDKNYLNHANSCMFSRIHLADNPIPLMYVTIGTGIGSDEDGFYYRCAVENIIQTQNSDGKACFRAQTVQVISYRPAAMVSGCFESPSWGCPAFFVDSQAGFFYIFSARYRTTKGHVPEGKQNAYIITKFKLPDVNAGGMIHLGSEDIIDQFSVESDVLFTQGGTLDGNRIYYTFGCPEKGYPIRILVFDLDKKSLIAQIGNLNDAFFQEEIECCAIYDGNLLCNTCDGSIFALERDLISDL